MKKQTFNPGSFAFIMATAALSSSLQVSNWTILSHIFLIIAIAGYMYFILQFAFVLLCNCKRTVKENSSIRNLFKWLTFSAGSTDLASRLLLEHHTTAGFVLSLVGAGSTIFIVYSIFCLLFFRAKESIETISPYWILIAIACQSAAIAFTLLWSADAVSSPLWLLSVVGFWTFGVIIYFLFMALDLYRMFFFPFSGKDLNSAYWTCMGGAAIAAYAGTQLLLVDHPPAFLSGIMSSLQGSVLFIWVWATAWIPILCLMGIWKYAYFKIPFTYSPSLWAVVFPLGMYTLATQYLHQSLNLDLQQLVPYLLIATLCAWLLMALRGVTSSQKQEF